MQQSPAGSLVLTVLNEERGLHAFLASLSAQTVLPTEIVIVDGGSTDNTVEILRSWPAPTGCELTLLVRPGASISEGRNIAVTLAQNERILVTDGGTILDARWVERMLAAFETPVQSQVIGGFFEPVGETFVERTIAFAVTPEREEIDPGTFLPSSRSLGFVREAWQSVGGYPEWLDYCEDLIFDIEMKEHGFTFVFVPDAVVTWSARSSIRSFMKQYFRYARGDGKANLWWKRHLARYAAYMVGIALFSASFFVPWAIVALALGFIVYMRKFWLRVWNRRASFGSGLLLALAMLPVIVVAGDLAKMAGYPVGLRWRAARKRKEECR